MTSESEKTNEEAMTRRGQEPKPKAIRIKTEGSTFVADSAAMKNVVARAEAFAVSQSPILLLGPRGSGKERLARKISDHSRRGSLVTVNCGQLRSDPTASELFGHVKGAYTGADRDKVGLFRQAHGGTLFLDEIGKLPLAAQGMLLRVIQEGEIRRVGENTTSTVDVRIIAASNDDLRTMAASGDFLPDLLDRLAFLTVVLPSLRERGDDALKIAVEHVGRFGKRFDTKAKSFILRHEWPGNVRELLSLVERAALLAGTDAISAENFRTELLQPNGPVTKKSDLPPDSDLADTRKVQALDLLINAFPDKIGRKEIEEALGAPRQSIVDALGALCESGWVVKRVVAEEGRDVFSCEPKWHQRCCHQTPAEVLIRSTEIFTPVRRTLTTDFMTPDEADRKVQKRTEEK